ncbi:serine/threonine protein kinase [Lasiodiplodia theobromae]|uniref:Serine/threonine-protein kinase TIO n=1 Tax=Lasiodiplodia theobromae TaxID=45133 RepID=A0A5N5DCQ7_9PEZI|nr:Serine/threonine-protein kinase TIO [Lasiodiplodia theobromae]KAF9635200.1 serine/threonine protein kinase [Lasiodiplodia theobromae]
MLHDGHAGEKAQEKKKKGGLARDYRFGSITTIMEEEDSEIIKKDEIPQDKSKQSEKPAASEKKIRHRLARMGTYLGISHGETEAVASHSEVAGESTKGTTEPNGGKIRTDEKESKAMKAVSAVKWKAPHEASSRVHHDKHVRFADNVGGYRVSKTDFIKKIQLLDPKARTKSTEDSEIPKSINEDGAKDCVSDPGEGEEDHFEQNTLRRKHTLEQFEGSINQATHPDQHPRIFDKDGILDTCFIPWDLFPDISRLRNFSKKAFDRGDGERFTIEEMEHVQDLLFLVRRALTRSHSLTVYQSCRLTQLVYTGKICLILDLIKQRQLLREFFRWGIDDDALPLPSARLQGIFEHCENTARVVEQFCTEQFRAVSRDWNNEVHNVMHRLEALPFRPLRPIGFGSQGLIDVVQLPNSKETCARKKWTAGTNLRKITARFDDEVKIIKKLGTHQHVLELLASYTRGREFGLLMPLADCDLWHILALNYSEREGVISDSDLLRSWGCLSSGLLFMHDKGVKHKDIKPQNILFRRGGFQFTDFGLSKDISELSHSTTEGADRGTLKYMAPEVTDYKPHGRAADVFSLACVLFEVYSVWLGLSIDDPDSFSALAPFHRNLSGVYSWIKTFLQISRGFGRYKRIQELFQPLFSQKPADRPHMRDVVSDMVIFLDPNDLFCSVCFLDLPVIHWQEGMIPRSSTSPPPTTTEGRSTGS